MTQCTAPTAQLVPAEARGDFLPFYLGTKHMMKGETLVYWWMSSLAPAYRGGYWHFYEIPNGFYMAPAGYERLRITWQMNYCDREMSADAAGIVATIFALSTLCGEVREDGLIELLRALREFATSHPESDAIMAAID